jgi:hypothetical protein
MRHAWIGLVILGTGLVAACSSGGSGGKSDGGGAGTSGAAGSGAGGTAGAAGMSGSAGAAGSTGAAGSAGAAGSTGAAGGTPTVGGLFTKPEPWTKDVSALPPSSRSSAIIKALNTLGGWGAGRMQIDFSIPLFFGDGSTPRQTITSRTGERYCYGGPDCEAVPLQMPVPAGSYLEGSADYTCDTTGKTDGQGDCHMLVVETAQKKLYELYNATKVGAAFTALGAFVWDLTKSYPDNERGDQCTSADAGGFPIAALLPTADEVAAGAVAHALRFILPNERMKKDVYVHPASHAGGPESTDANAPPYGVRFRLKATFDETKYKTGERVILRALKTYGMLLSDGGNIALTFADDRTTKAKWDGVGITPLSFSAIKPDDFEVVDLGAEVPVTNDCVRNP